MSRHKLDLRKATIARLAQLYPACFYVARQQRRPLKIGIRHDLAALNLGIGRRELGSALAWYVNGIGYLRSLRVGADRIGLDGAPGGVVSGADEGHAREKLAALGARRASDAEANSRPESVGGGVVATRAGLQSPYQVAEARLLVGSNRALSRLLGNRNRRHQVGSALPDCARPRWRGRRQVETRRRRREFE
jgi:sRNA-binding protein